MSDSFVFRRARAADETAVCALSALIWEGSDYAGDSFGAWLADEMGQFTVVYDGERLAAFGKLSCLSPGEWWLEGLRVHPDYQGRGLARRLHDYALNLADEMGSGTLRFSTASTTPATHRLAETTGFARTQVRLWAGLDREGLDQAGVERAESAVPVAPMGSFVPVASAELPTFTNQLTQSDQFTASSGLFEHDWKLWLILPRLEQFQAEQRLFWWLRAGQPAGLVIRTLTERSASLSYFQADPADWSHLLEEARRWLLATGAAEIRTKPPKSATVKAALLAAGWMVDEEIELWGYERPLRGA